MVLDNASVHRSKGIKAAPPERKVLGIHLWYPPAYNPELNTSERVFRRVQAPDQARPFTAASQLMAAADHVFRQVNAQLTPSNSLEPDA